ncbi:MAG: magnesium chelatase [Ignavibacteriaceae bacterium]|nr:magnesium chelatase [Ignavibacteria bacterium]MBT8391137.1 magnesium chelatase [Ignavibacteria bacterium]NNJ52165.1 magnesium chelatase [Ignavibacteriaceae bacterium]NNL20014.1 magnesium chelatase [Ignavibacteriaceae bacterium]
MTNTQISTLGELKQNGYKSKSIKNELRDNLIQSLKGRKNPFEGIIGFDDTVIPELQTAILSRHDIILLGLRGQAKTKIARLLVNLLDEYIPIVEGSELNDDPLNPLSVAANEIIKKDGDKTKINWIHRSERYTEKLATPDVSVADLIGDVDPIKAAALKLPYSDERVIHFGLIPRSHRSIFVINELPDLQARIQVALFNILQESDIQIRGFKVRLPLDIQFVFTANPEDYTNRGAIVTPLKDRIDSQILTHYPKSIEASKRITEQEAQLSADQKEKISTDEILNDLIEQIAFEARESEYIDAKSGVSARLTISAYENLISTAERRRIVNDEDETQLRISDVFGVIPSITGKIELVYEGEQEGPAKVAQILIGKAIKNNFTKYFPSPDSLKKTEQPNPYQQIVEWFKKGNKIDLMVNSSNKEYVKIIKSVPCIAEVVKKYHPKVNGFNKTLLTEFLLFGLSEYSLLSRTKIEDGMEFRDMLSSMFTMPQDDDFEDEDESTFYKS